jgi:hypothetical protein
MEKVVYNTGKVKIGLRYEPPKDRHISPEGERIQRVLLDVERREFRENLGWCIYLAVVLAVSVVAVALVG